MGENAINLQTKLLSELVQNFVLLPSRNRVFDTFMAHRKTERLLSKLTSIRLRGNILPFFFYFYFKNVFDKIYFLA